MVDDKIVGGIIATPTRDGNWYVNSLFVHPSYRKHGVASRLLSKIIKTAGNKKIFLDIKQTGDSSWIFTISMVSSYKSWKKITIMMEVTVIF